MLDASPGHRYAVRWLLRSPGFAAVAILSLGVGIGCNTAIFAVVDALLLRPLPVHEPSRLVDIYTSGADGDTYSTNSLPDILDYREQKDVFADVAGYSPMFAAVSRGDRARLVLGEVVTGNYFSTLGVAARLGRTLLPEDDAPDARANGRAVEPVLATRVRRRPVGGRTDAPHPRAGVHDRRRARRHVHRHGADAGAGDLGAGALRGRSRASRHQRGRAVADWLVAARSPRPALAVRQGTARADDVGRAGARQRRGRRGAPARRASADEQGSPGHRAADLRHPAPSRSGPHARVDRLGDDARGGPRAGHRVRERRRHAARARRRPSARDRDPPGGRRRSRPAGAPAADREPRSSACSAPASACCSPPG